MPDDALEALYSEERLAELVKRASAARGKLAGDLEFAGYKIACLSGLFEGVSIDYVTTSLLQLDDNFKIIDIECVPWNLPISIIESYTKHGDFDATSEPVYKNAGRIVSSHEWISEKDFEESYFYIHHCAPHNIKRGLMIAFRHPTHARTMVTFDYLFAPANDSWTLIDRSALEFGSFLFALAWLYRKGEMDIHHLQYLFRLMHSMTADELLYLRKYINSPHLDLGRQASDMGVTRRQYTRPLYRLRERLKERSRWYADIIDFIAGSQPLRVLDSEYSFLRMLGDPTKPLAL